MYYVGAVLISLFMFWVCLQKDRVGLGVVGLFVPLVMLVATIRLARPASPWAQKYYKGEKLLRAQQRYPEVV